MDGIDALIESLRQDRPDLQIVPSDFDGTYSASGFYTILYMLTRVYGASDWQTGESIRLGMLGQVSQLEMHHIFPKSLLDKDRVPAKQINNLGNIAFQTSLTNKSIGNDSPADYLADIADQLPGALESQWVPMERSQWQISEYEAFLTSRRTKLADAANEFLAALHGGSLQSTDDGPDDVHHRLEVIGDSDDWIEERAALIEEFNAYAPGVVNHPIRLVDGNVIYLDVAWPEGLQLGISQPAAFLFGPDDEVFHAANQAGFVVFTDREQLLHYLRSIDEGDIDAELD